MPGVATMNEFSNTPVGKRLIRMGLMDPETTATRRARAVLCRHCRRAVMLGITAIPGGLTIQADPSPLSRLGEALALMTGRRTVELRWVGDRYEIDLRDHFRIRGSPAGTNGVDVLVVHDCAQAQGLPFVYAESVLRDHELRSIPLPIDPPF